MEYLEKEEIFWQWFEKNEEKYHGFSRIPASPEKEALTKALLQQLHKYCDQLSFEIMYNPDFESEEYFIITAKGNVDYFRTAATLNDYAPPGLPHWVFEVFIPPANHYTMFYMLEYHGIKLNPETIWYKPILNPADPSILAITVFFKTYNKHKDHPKLKEAIAELLYIDLGEESYTLDLRYFEMAQLPPDPVKRGLSRLYELSGYIEWHYTKKITYSEN